MRVPLLILLATTSLLAGCAATRNAQPAAATPATIAVTPARTDVPTQLPRNARPLHYSIAVVPDAANLRFTGHSDATIQIFEASDTITLNAADLTFGDVRLTRADAPQAAPAAPRAIDVDEQAQTASFRFADRLVPGRYRLSIDYTGRIYTQSSGRFALDYQTADGAKRALFTQFEAPDARRFFPGWDEPQFRTPYDLSVTVPAGQQAISNMPEAGREPLADGRTRVRFATSPSMSSYLLFLAVGELDRITTAAAGTEIGIVTRRGAGEQGRFALESSARIVPWLNDYFGTHYPLPKLDNVAGPGSSQTFGAMENWGAIFSFESILLVDPAITSEARRQSIFKVAAHEIAHQWFGNLVTMAWWDDLWLNEGFASWMATKITAALHPEWEPLLDRVSGRESAIFLDSLRTTHPVVQRIETVEQISQAFDAITYRKGEAVITMIEDYVGETAWRTGVRAYIARHHLSNTVTDDLWRAIEQASSIPVTAIAHDFTLQPGVPLVRVERADCRNGRTHITLRQGEYSRDRQNEPPRAWRVPVIAAVGDQTQRILVEGGQSQASVRGCGPLIVNYGQAGYYRTFYAPALLARLTAGFARLRPIDQLGLLADQWSLGLAGYQSPTVALDMIAALPANAHSRVMTRVGNIFRQIAPYYRDNPNERQRWARFAFAALEPALRHVGWEERAGEPAPDAVLRNDLIFLLGHLGHPDTLAELQRRFATNHRSVVAGPLRQTILTIVAYHADAATWERLRIMARDERNPLVRVQLYELLGGVRDEALARRTLDLALTQEPGATNAAELIAAVADEHPDLAFDFALAHRERVEALVDQSARSRFFPRLAGTSIDPATIARLEDYARRHLTPQSRGEADRIIAVIRDRIRVRQEQLPAISRWLDARS
ncbi:MAG: M1 family aminopeptidase [Sphingosinicella sp.]